MATDLEIENKTVVVLVVIICVTIAICISIMSSCAQVVYTHGRSIVAATPAKASWEMEQRAAVVATVAAEETARW